MRRYTKSHEWIDIDGNIATIGITKEARQEIGEIVYLELPHEGLTLDADTVAVVLESTKAAVDISTPLSGKVREVNKALRASTQPLNQSPEKDGWLFSLEIQSLDELEPLLDEESYRAYQKMASPVWDAI